MIESVLDVVVTTLARQARAAEVVAR